MPQIVEAERMLIGRQRGSCCGRELSDVASPRNKASLRSASVGCAYGCAYRRVSVGRNLVLLAATAFWPILRHFSTLRSSVRLDCMDF
jgi:hypothetical protein